MKERRGGMDGKPAKASSLKPKGRPPASALKRYRGIFKKDIPRIMYGYGDYQCPIPETVTLVEDIVVDYVTVLVHKAQNMSGGQLLAKDLLSIISKDLPKYHRCLELLRMQKEIETEKKVMKKL